MDPSLTKESAQGCSEFQSRSLCNREGGDLREIVDVRSWRIRQMYTAPLPFDIMELVFHSLFVDCLHAENDNGARGVRELWGYIDCFLVNVR